MIPDRYNWKKLKQAVRNPQKFENEVRTLLAESLRSVQKATFKLRFGTGIDIMAKDWDNLIILDACRVDALQDVNMEGGYLDKVVSKGSNSKEFMERNFKGRNLNDTVYITGNPHCHTVGIEDVFYDIVYSYDSGSYTENRWNEMTVAEENSPESVYQSAVRNIDSYEDKRKIIHFMQPHAPYHGPTARELRKRLNEDQSLVFSHLTKHSEIPDVEADNVYNSLLHAVDDGYVSPEKMREIYDENLEVVLEYVADLLDDLEGKTVITADHGELLGESIESKFKRLYYPSATGHPSASFVPELRLVPWLEIPSDNRPEIIPEESIDATDVDSDIIEDQLEALGYKD